MAASSEPVSLLLELPPEVVDRVAYLLPPGDRCNLAATSTKLRAASRRWFRGAVVHVYSGNSRLTELRNWVEARQALVAVRLLPPLQQLQVGLATLPPGRIVSIQDGQLPLGLKWAAPTVLARLSALTQLQLTRQTQLRDGSLLGQILQPLAQLRELTVSRCQLAVLPAALSCCTQLTRLELPNNALAGGWQHLQPLVQLQQLALNGTALLPPDLQQLTQLTRLVLAHCGGVPAVSPHLAVLHLLQDLDLTQCSLSEVPAAVPALTALTALHLGHNRLQGGFDRLRPLMRLQVLHLHNNDLAEVPPAVAQLAALQTLTLGNPPAGWQHLRPLAQLRSLDAFWYLDRAPDSHFPLASEAAGNLHPATVQRMLAQPDGELPRLLAKLAQRGLPRPV